MPHHTTELIPLTNNNDGTQAVMGRDLHAFLESKEPYTRWISRHIEKYGFVAGQDFLTEMSESTGGRPAENHILTMDMAKELAMLQGNHRGKQARQYFIEVEKQHRANINTPMSRMELLQIAMQAEQERLALEAKTRELEPKAEAYDTFLDSTGVYNVGTVAKMFGKGQNWMFKELRNCGVFIAKGAMRNTPYQQYMHHFEVKASSFERSNGERQTTYTTYVQPSGVDFIGRKLGLRRVAA